MWSWKRLTCLLKNTWMKEVCQLYLGYCPTLERSALSSKVLGQYGPIGMWWRDL